MAHGEGHGANASEHSHLECFVTLAALADLELDGLTFDQ